MRHKERRHHDRIEGQALPADLQTMNVEFSDGRKVEARTIDASPYDIALLVPLSSAEIDAYEVSLEDPSGRFHIADELVYTKSVDEHSARVSVKFSPEADLGAYREILRGGGPEN